MDKFEVTIGDKVMLNEDAPDEVGSEMNPGEEYMVVGVRGTDGFLHLGRFCA